VGKRVRRQLRGCGVEEARGFSNWPHVSAPSPVVLPAEHGGRTTGWRCPYSLFRGRDTEWYPQNMGAEPRGGVALTVFLGVEIRSGILRRRWRAATPQRCGLVSVRCLELDIVHNDFCILLKICESDIYF
jgi:hypothetical protein